MQTDLQALLITTGAVCGIYSLVNLLRRRRKNAMFDQVEISEEDDEDTSTDKNQSDPLMDGMIQSKRVIVDQTIAHSPINMSELSEEMEEMPAEEVFEPEYASPEETTFVALTVLAKRDQPFSGAHLFNALKTNHLYYGKEGVFHRHRDDNPMQPPLYSVVSMVEPGTFDIDTLSNDTYKGIVLIMTLSNRTNPLVTFEKMLNSARQLTVTLDGELCDIQRKPLTAQMMSQLREKIQKNHRKNLTTAGI